MARLDKRNQKGDASAKWGAQRWYKKECGQAGKLNEYHQWGSRRTQKVDLRGNKCLK